MPARPMASHVGASAVGQQRPDQRVGERDGDAADAGGRDAVELLQADEAVVGQVAVPAPGDVEGEAEEQAQGNAGQRRGPDVLPLLDEVEAAHPPDTTPMVNWGRPSRAR